MIFPARNLQFVDEFLQISRTPNTSNVLSTAAGSDFQQLWEGQEPRWHRLCHAGEIAEIHRQWWMVRYGTQ